MTEELIMVSGNITKGKSKGTKFMAAAVSKDGKIVRAAPFLKHSVGRPALWLEQYAQLQKWTVERKPVNEPGG